MTAECPVCRRKVWASKQTGRVSRHHDKAWNRCPMSWHHIPLEQLERRAA